MPRLVVDANYAKDERLREWLARRTDNVAVLTDYFAAEAYRTGSIQGVRGQFAIVRQFPRQVRILRPSGALMHLPVRQAVMGKCEYLIDESETKRFSTFCRHLERIPAHPALTKSFDRQIASAHSRQEQLRTMVRNVSQVLDGMEGTFALADLATLRSAGPYSDGAAQTIVRYVVHLAAGLMKRLPAHARPSSFAEAMFTFAFRLTLCSYLTWKNRLADGAGPTLGPKQAGNDLIDAYYCASAIYFDGLLSNDERAVNVYTEAAYLMSHVFMPLARDLLRLDNGNEPPIAERTAGSSPRSA